jgi:hypothetical protein
VVGRDEDCGAKRLGDGGAAGEKAGVEATDFAGSPTFAPSTGVLGLGEKREPNGAAAGRDFCSGVGWVVVDGLGAKRLPKGFAWGVFGLSVSAEAGLGANRLPVAGAWKGPVDVVVEGAGAALSLLEKRLAPVVEEENWKPVLGGAASPLVSACSFSSAGFGVADGEGAPEKRFEDWKGFWNGVAGLDGDAVPKSVVDVVVVGVAAVNAGVGAVAPAVVCREVAPKRGVDVGVACSVGFAPKSGLDGVC